MAHHRRAIGAAVLLNSAIVAGEAAAGWHSGSLSLLMDAVHNCSDELALICLYLACWWPGRLGRNTQRAANVLNSAGLVALSVVLVVQAVARLDAPPPVSGGWPLGAGMLAAAANAGVAAFLSTPARKHAAVRLAWLHNRGDILVSLAPAAAGVLMLATGNPLFDPLVALLVAAWIAFGTLREVRASANELLWPDDLTCVHEEPVRETTT